MKQKTDMEKTKLIQRLRKPVNYSGLGFKDNPFSFGGGLKSGGVSASAMAMLRCIWDFDYMGAAEFEFGAVPKALQKMSDQAFADNLVNGTWNKKEEEVFYICQREHEEEVKRRIAQLRTGKERNFNGEIYARERCFLKEWFEPDGYGWRNKDYVGWLELDNGFAFFVDREMFDKSCLIFGLNS